MKVVKEKQFLTFYLNDGSTVRYNLQTQETIGKRGLPVKTLNSQLKGITLEDIIKSFEDKNYAEFFRFIRDNYYTPIQNISSIIEIAKDYSHLEQYFAAGIYNIDGDISVPMSDIPSGLIKICKKYSDLCLSYSLYKTYCSTPDLYNLAFNMYESGELYGVSILKIFDILTNTGNIVYDEHSYFREWDRKSSRVACLIDQFSYNPTRLFLYLNYLYTREAYPNIYDALTDLIDYTRMASSISNKFEKYPKSLRTIHDITARNYKRIKKAYDEKLFLDRVDTSLEFKHGKYIILYPKSTQEIKDEAVYQGNCVASYIEDIISGKTDVLFLRSVSAPDKSLVTIEVQNNRVVQKEGKHRRSLNQKENEVIRQYNKYLSLRNR